MCCVNPLHIGQQDEKLSTNEGGDTSRQLVIVVYIGKLHEHYCLRDLNNLNMMAKEKEYKLARKSCAKLSGPLAPNV